MSLVIDFLFFTALCFYGFEDFAFPLDLWFAKAFDFEVTA